MANATIEQVDRAARVQERLEHAVARIETAVTGLAMKGERRHRDLDALRTENADRTSRDEQIARRLDKTIDRLRALLEE